MCLVVPLILIVAFILADGGEYGNATTCNTVQSPNEACPVAQLQGLSMLMLTQSIKKAPVMLDKFDSNSGSKSFTKMHSDQQAPIMLDEFDSSSGSKSFTKMHSDQQANRKLHSKDIMRLKEWIKMILNWVYDLFHLGAAKSSDPTLSDVVEQPPAVETSDEIVTATHPHEVITDRVIFEGGWRKTNLSSTTRKTVLNLFHTLKSSIPPDHEVFDKHLRDAINLVNNSGNHGFSALFENDDLLSHDMQIAIRALIELRSSLFDVNADVANGIEFTSEMLREIFEQDHTLEEVKPQDEAFSIQGDMLSSNPVSWAALQSAARKDRRWAGELWPVGESIPFCFATNIVESSRAAFVGAVEQISAAVPCLSFEEVATESGASEDLDKQKKCEVAPAIFVQSEPSGFCNAYVGVQKNMDIVRVQLAPDGCDVIGVAVHELGHAIGMAHEQSRPDRDQYVLVDHSNIQPGKENNFAINEEADTTVPYDYLSVMHYGDDFFGIPDEHGNPKETLVPRRKFGHWEMGNRMGATHRDILQLGKMYGCAEDVSNVCTHAKDECTFEACVCHTVTHDPVLKMEFIATNGTKCWACREQCPLGTGTCSYLDQCQCPFDYVKTAHAMASGSCYSCEPPPPNYCPDQGTSCSLDDKCVCPDALVRHKSVSSTTGEPCYSCNPLCPSTAGQATLDDRCICPGSLRKTTFSCGWWTDCWGCRGVPTTQNGCPCKKSWEVYGYTHDDYCLKYGENGASFCVPEDLDCEPGNQPYGWCMW